MSKHVLAFTPTFGAGPHPDCIPSIDAQVFDGRVEQQVGWHNPYPGADHRNVLAQYEMSRTLLLSSSADALLLVEHDMVLPPDTLAKLYCTDAPVVYAVYRFRHGTHVLNACRYENDHALGESLTWHPAEVQAAQRRGWATVSGQGFGCTLIRRPVVERLPFRRNDDSPLPDHVFALDCVTNGIGQIARFDAPVVHIDSGDQRIEVWSQPMETVTVIALQDVTVPTGNGVHPLRRGNTYQIATAEASELQRAGYIRIETPEWVEPKAEPEKPKRKRAAE